MTYPQPPWLLRGYAIQTLQLVEIDRIRPHIPSELEIISVFPGKTIGGIYLAAYGDGSTLTYNELIVVGAMVHKGTNFGGWISHIYVDHPDSIAGGRQIWGLPKEQADFTWNHQGPLSVTVQQGNQTLCRLESRWQIPGWSQPLTVPVISTKASHLACFNGQANFKVHLANAALFIPPESPFAPLKLDKPMLSFYCNPLELVANPPSLIS
ncbi:acetoacetate decarboxylase family protein [Egbenema bharatensis]|uniref:acetoacetate decarboxylase family protein n=1 Tax=Egbenema bharatensis TaxID=3463334 RepID=UPI003A8C827C